VLANTPRSVPVEENSSITLNIDGAVALITAKCFFLPNSCISPFEVKQDDLVAIAVSFSSKTLGIGGALFNGSDLTTKR
jgi:hypothetical protein